MRPFLAGIIGYSLGLLLHFCCRAAFVFNAAAAGKPAARLFGEFALSGLAGMVVTACVIAVGSRRRGSAASAGQVAGRRRELPAGLLRCAAGIVFAAADAPSASKSV